LSVICIIKQNKTCPWLSSYYSIYNSYYAILYHQHCSHYLKFKRLQKIYSRLVYFLDWVQTKSILLTHILYCLLSWLGSDKIDTLDTHTLLFTFLTGFRHNRYSWHTYFIFYFLDWVQTKSILLTHIHCLLSWLGSETQSGK
jgi:hypothetical protein